MIRSLADYIDFVAGILPEALDHLRAQSPEGFVHVSEQLLVRAIAHLEEQANNLRTYSENAITSAAIGFLNRAGIHASSQENSRGHVDIFMRHSRRQWMVICGEAKIWNGASKHFEGLAQVLKYSTGRIPNCFILVYVKTGAIEDYIQTIENRLNSDLPEQQLEACRKHESMRWAVVSAHNHQSGTRISVLHVGANLALPDNTSKP